jgi:hypothetical protein
MKFMARIGKARYELEESSPEILKVTRLGPGEQTFFLPRVLVVDYVMHKVGPKVSDAIVKAMAEKK